VKYKWQKFKPLPVIKVKEGKFDYIQIIYDKSVFSFFDNIDIQKKT